MIAHISGTLLSKTIPFVVVDVAGVGYELQVTTTAFDELPAVGDSVTVKTHLIVREDAHLLYGFSGDMERALFRELIKISGVGAKLAIAILSGISVESFIDCVRESDKATLTRLPGVGKKTAERLIIEMRDRINKGEFNRLGVTTIRMTGQSVSQVFQNNAVQDAVSALIALGYKPVEATQLVSRIEADGLDSEAIIRLALQANLPRTGS